MERIFAFFLLILASPFIALLGIAVKLTSPGPFIFKQKRIGKNDKPFILYKIRTMVNNADKLQKKLQQYNEADGPVFKIRHDPRYTAIGKFLSHTGLDELLQLINIIKGEMSFIGPRPLPPREASGVPNKYKERFKIKPGLTSPWVVRGTHRLTFSEWMQSDIDYLRNKNKWHDTKLVAQTVVVTVFLIFKKIKELVFPRRFPHA